MLFPATKQNVIEDCHVFYLKWSGPLCSSLMSGGSNPTIYKTYNISKFDKPEKIPGIDKSCILFEFRSLQKRDKNKTKT